MPHISYDDYAYGERKYFHDLFTIIPTEIGITGAVSGSPIPPHPVKDEKQELLDTILWGGKAKEPEPNPKASQAHRDTIAIMDGFAPFTISKRKSLTAGDIRKTITYWSKP